VSNSFGFGVSNATSYLLGVGILILAIFFVAAFLNAVYDAVPNVREILNGVLGLGKQESEVISLSDEWIQKRTTYAELVKQDSRIKIEDIALLYNSEVDAYVSLWTFQVGLVVGVWIAIPSIILAAVVVGPPDLITALIKLGLLFVVAVALILLGVAFLRLVLPRYGKDPYAVRMKRFKEYLDAKSAIADRDKKKVGENS